MTTQTTNDRLLLAAQLVTRARFGSPSMIKRVLRQKHDIEVTFTEAVGFLDQMHERGIVGPAHGSFAREVLMTPEMAEYVLTPCDFVACDSDGGEPCDTHERLMAHAEGDHELCDHATA
jgi:hypothetical protein